MGEGGEGTGGGWRLEDGWLLKPDGSRLPILYHATTEDRLAAIFTEGLGGGGRARYEASRTGCVYLADDPDTAEAYLREAQFGCEGEIVLLEVAVAALEPGFLSDDPNHDAGTFGGESFVYRGIVPPSGLRCAQVAIPFEDQTAPGP